MRNIMLIFKNTYKNNKVILLAALAIGLIAVSVFYGINQSNVELLVERKVSIGIIDDDNSFLSQELQRYLEEELNVALVTGSEKELNKQLLNYHISVIIEVPKGFYDSLYGDAPLSITLETLNDFENSIFIENDINSYVSMVQTIIHSSGDKSQVEEILKTDSSEISFEVSALGSDDTGVSAIFLIHGILVMFLGIICVFISNDIYRDKTNMVYHRLKTSNLSPFAYISGQALFGYLICLIPVVMALSFIYMSGDTTTPIWLLGIAYLLYSIFVVGFAILIGIVSKSKSTCGLVATTFYTITAMVGGAWFPIEDIGGILSKLAYFSPAYWVISIAIEELSYMMNIIVLVLINIFVYLTCIVLFKSKERNN